MSADPCPAVESGSAVTEALYFSSGAHRLFGWLHRTSRPTRSGVGLLICKPFGYEAVCSHLSVRAFAEAAAAIGVPALRFDYAGTGDSSELDESANRLDIWVRDVEAGVEALKRACNLECVVILGLRLGALLACLASERTAVAGLVLIAPVTSGRRYLKELRTIRLAGSIGESRDAAQKLASAPLQVSGFTLSAATVEALASVEISPRALSRDQNLLVIDGIQTPGARAWCEEVAPGGPSVRYRELPGLVQMLMTAPQFSSVPVAMIAATCDWLQELPQQRDVRATSFSDRHVAAAEGHELRLPAILGSEQPEITERPLYFGPEEVLFGILTEPAAGEARRRGVVLVNAGGDYHIGASGLYVSLARRWARRGYLVLRMDLAGLGDSGTREGQRDNDIFPRYAVDDIREAISWMRKHRGVTDITVGGVCSGAYHSLRAAVELLPVNRILMVNPETFFWDETKSIHDMQTAELVRGPRIYGGKLVSLDTWKKLLRGKVDVGYVARFFARRLLLALESHIYDAARLLRLHLPRDLGWVLQDIAARGVQIVLVFSRGEPGLRLMRIQAGSSIRRLGGQFKLHVIDGADHIFSKLESRMALENTLSQELYARPEPATSGGALIRQAAAPACEQPPSA